MSAVTPIKEKQPLTGITKKVYECVPVLEAQQQHKIEADLKSRTGSTADRAVITACLDDLVDLWLIKRVGSDRYQRGLVQQASTQSAQTSSGRQSGEDVPDMLLKVAIEMRDCASHFASRFKLLADRLDAIAEQAEQGGSEEAEAVSKLRQLQSLLKGL